MEYDLKKIALFGGSFDPIHFGHLNLAIQMQENHQLDRVLFCPAHISPFKQEEPPCAAPRHRQAMVERAISAIPSFALLDEELRRKGISFTIDTMRYLRKEYPDAALFFILGEGRGLDKWREVDALLKLASPLVGARYAAEGAPISIMEISSTKIRARLKMQKYCGHLVPEKTLNYIYEQKLYTGNS
jgi:nicotinate-nucleotide adenylyltransferase